MGNCATKPKVIKDSDEDLVPVDRETTDPADHKKDPSVKCENNVPNTEEEAAAAARRSEKGKNILIENDVADHSKRPSLTHLFRENNTMEFRDGITTLFPSKPKTNKKTAASSDVLKFDTSAPISSNVKVPETFDVQTRNDLEVKIPKDSEVKTPKANEANEQEVNFLENMEAENLKKTSNEESKVPEVSASELSEVKVTDKADVAEVLDDKNISKVSKVKSDEVKIAESELLKVSQVKSLEDLEIKVPKVFEVKPPESEMKSDEQEASKIKIPEVTEFVNAHEKIDKLDQEQIHEDIKVTKDKETVLPKVEKEEEKDASLEKQVKETTTLSVFENK